MDWDAIVRTRTVIKNLRKRGVRIVLTPPLRYPKSPNLDNSVSDFRLRNRHGKLEFMTLVSLPGLKPLFSRVSGIQAL